MQITFIVFLGQCFGHQRLDTNMQGQHVLEDTEMFLRE